MKMLEKFKSWMLSSLQAYLDPRAVRTGSLDGRLMLYDIFSDKPEKAAWPPTKEPSVEFHIQKLLCKINNKLVISKFQKKW